MARLYDEETTSCWKSIFYNAQDVAENGYHADKKETAWHYDQPLTDEVIQKIEQKAKSLECDIFEIIEKKEKIKRYQVD
ncbi:hypothetical protein AWH56_005320 [Anaerobacillus isosaccharinicus]|uniref:Uncharacterized protein n=1 Tax=Anaerobacillus isosaccharinicus TaxID=1532552 RepID=A0A1S2LBY2_9BACI|nr:hypothetical protein [Anaerobacillus isosaccharinicus]MBA5584554.1 hypothetical protein [Anaerobacillus isosaccharinicus]QOY37062.1 hypothetical protein AWH56_005320 [Anaerobacillus isosaccharinicus]